MKRMIKLSTWARAHDVSKLTAWRRATSGMIPGAVQQNTQWYVEVEDDTPPPVTVAYARVSSHEQKPDLDRQVARIAEWAAASGTRIDRFVREIGSGMNGKRKVLGSLLSDPTVTTIVVEHRDRLSRFGFDLVETTLSASNRKIVVIDPREVDNDLVRDLIEIMSSFSARLYGQRSAAIRANKALRALEIPEE